MQVFDFDVTVQEVVCKVFGHFFGQCCDKHALMPADPFFYFIKEIIDLAFYGTYLYFGVKQPCRADDLFHYPIGKVELIIAWRCGKVYCLAYMGQEFIPFQRAVIHSAGQPEPIFDKGAFTACIAFIHRPDLRDRLM